MLDYVQKKKLRVISTNALQEACKIAIKLKHNILVSYKSKSQPVTNADKQIDLYLRSFFKSKTPNIGWLSEESIDDHSRFNKKLFWCLDPIDGTRSYINKKPEYTISLALIDNFLASANHCSVKYGSIIELDLSPYGTLFFIFSSLTNKLRFFKSSKIIFLASNLSRP